MHLFVTLLIKIEQTKYETLPKRPRNTQNIFYVNNYFFELECYLRNNARFQINTYTHTYIATVHVVFR